MSNACIQCRTQPGRFEELNNTAYVFCGKICQWEYHLIGLKDDALGINNVEIIGLEANDGKTRIRITASQARRMKTIEHLLEDIGSPDDYIPLPSVDGDSLKLIEKLLQEELTYGKKIKIFGFAGFRDLLNAASYLDFRELVLHLMPEWVNERYLFGVKDLKSLAPIAVYFHTGELGREIKFFLSRKMLNNWDTFRKYFNFRGFILAASDGQLEVINALLKNIALDPSVYENAAIRHAAENGQLAVVERLLEDKRVDPSDVVNYAIRKASHFGHLAVVERLLKDPRVDPSDRDNEAISHAAGMKHWAVVERLLKDERVDPSAWNNVVIIDAARDGKLEIVERLLKDPRVDPSAQKNSAIQLAKQNNHLTVVKRLLQDPRVKDNNAVY